MGAINPWHNDRDARTLSNATVLSETKGNITTVAYRMQ